MFHHLLSLLYPSPVTAQPTALPRCAPLRINTVHLRAQGVRFLDGLTAAALYVESAELQEAIRHFKYNRQRQLCDILVRPMADAFLVCSPNTRTALCPVPLHWSRRFARGFNQAELLARGLSRATGQSVVTCLRRVRPTGHQAWRSHDERRLALDDAFVARGSVPSHVTLVDDVATTMSTLDACARALKDAGVLHVDAIVIALG